ncbi:MAG: histidine kinase [Desulfuromonadales bacterium]|nr:MAG: histidine kinase [Desulfuromonadales bacterium]
MKKLVVIATTITLCLTAAVSFAEDRASKADAEKMVKKAAKAIKDKGDAVYKDITAPAKTYVDKDLYIVVYDMNGKCLAHGQNAKQVGRDLIGLKDADGKEFVKERVDLAKSKKTFWQDYKFTDPLTKQTLPKQMYCEQSGKVIVCGGVYKQ